MTDQVSEELERRRKELSQLKGPARERLIRAIARLLFAEDEKKRRLEALRKIDR